MMQLYILLRCSNCYAEYYSYDMDMEKFQVHTTNIGNIILEKLEDSKQLGRSGSTCPVCMAGFDRMQVVVKRDEGRSNYPEL